uniref:Zf-C3H1 domain-containing protein n=1 Tax=Elaeophora elaphi TaxID=1147741 RepID=A0A0R3RHX8_9BILA
MYSNCRNASTEIRPRGYVSSASVEEEREREVDRIIREVQETRDRSKFTTILSSDDENALRLTVLNTSKDKRFVQRPTSHEAEEGEIIDTCVIPRIQQIKVHSSSRQNWVQLKRKQNNRFQKYSDVQNRIKNRKLHDASVPLKVTVRNDNASGHSFCFLNHQQKVAAPTSGVEMMETTVKQFENPFEEQLHRLRLRVEASKFSKKVENLGDNYEQVGMDIVDSDRDSRSRSSPTSPLVDAVVVRPHDVQSRNEIPSDGADNEEDVDQLRAELLEQIMQKKNDKKRKSLEPTLEEGELSSTNSEEQATHGSKEGPSSSYRSETHCSKRFKNVIEQNRKSMVDRKRSRKDSLSSGTDDGGQDCRIKLSRKKEKFQGTIPKRLHWKARNEFSDMSRTEERKAEDWERMINVEKKMLKDIERKLRHRDDQKCVTRRKRDSFLERANRCAHQLGVLEAEMEVLRCNQEKVKGRLSYLERQLSKAQFEEDDEKAERKIYGKESKRNERLLEETESIKNLSKDVGHSYDPIEITVESKNDAGGSKTTDAHVLEHSEPSNTTMAMDDFDDRDDVSRPASSSSGSHHSSIDILGDSDIIELSDSSDSMNGLITAMRELEQEELEANFIAEAATVVNPNVCHESQQEERKTNRTVALSEKDIEELKNNPLIMFNGYRISPTFPYRLIAHRAVSNKLDPLKPLCYYELLGRCADSTCSMQHEEDYLLSDEELICSVLAYCPNLCPPKKMFSEYAREILKEHQAKPVGEIIEDMLRSLPDTERRIRVCEMATKSEPQSKWSSKGHFVIVFGKLQFARVLNYLIQ